MVQKAQKQNLQESVVFLEHLGCITLEVLSLKWNGIVLRVVHSSSVIKRWDPTQTTHQQSLYLYLIMVRGCQFGLALLIQLSSYSSISQLLPLFVVLRKQLSFLKSTHAPSTAKQHCCRIDYCCCCTAGSADIMMTPNNWRCLTEKICRPCIWILHPPDCVLKWCFMRTLLGKQIATAELKFDVMIETWCKLPNIIHTSHDALSFLWNIHVKPISKHSAPQLARQNVTPWSRNFCDREIGMSSLNFTLLIKILPKHRFL